MNIWPKNKNNISNQGVTIVELSISLAIIGLLISLVVLGYNLYHGAEIRKTISEITDLNSAIDEFTKQYNYLPGDLPTATNYWGTFSKNINNDGVYNGDGDSYINNDEDLYSFKHLSRAGLIFGNFSSVKYNSEERFKSGINAPKSTIFVDGLYRFYDITNPVNNNSGHVIQLGAADSTGLPNNPVIKAKDIYAIDQKIDDGIPTTGLVSGVNGNNSSCLDSNLNYNFSLDQKNCILLYWHKKF